VAWVWLLLFTYTAHVNIHDPGADAEICFFLGGGPRSRRYRASTPKASRARRRRRRAGGEWGVSPPQPTRESGERRKLPQRGPGPSPRPKLNFVKSELQVCTGMGMAGIQRNLREYRGDGSNNCGIPAGMDIITAGTPREWSANVPVKMF